MMINVVVNLQTLVSIAKNRHPRCSLRLLNIYLR